MAYLFNGISLRHKNETMPCAATWMRLEIIKLNEVKQRKTGTYDITYMRSQK